MCKVTKVDTETLLIGVNILYDSPLQCARRRTKTQKELTAVLGSQNSLADQWLLLDKLNIPCIQICIGILFLSVRGDC